jgi:hypothetical protein
MGPIAPAEHGPRAFVLIERSAVVEGGVLPAAGVAGGEQAQQRAMGRCWQRCPERRRLSADSGDDFLARNS